MSTSIDLTSSGLQVKTRDGESKELSELLFPSQHQIVILDTETKKADQKVITRIPLSFQIRYNNKAEDPPALVMLINPSSLNVTRDKKINSEFTRGGHVIEEWGEMQENLQFTGKIGGYFVLNPQIDFSGLNRYHRSRSPSFRNLMNLFMIYRNNGMVYEKTLKDSQDSPENRLMRNSGLSKVNNRIPKMAKTVKNRIAVVGDVFLNYDGVSYKGAFDDFSIEESSDAPYTLSYKFTFIVQSKIETDKRTLDTYLQRSEELGDVANRKPVTSAGKKQLENRLKQLERGIRSALEVSQEAEADNRSFLAEKEVVSLNPRHPSRVDQVNVENYVELAAKDHNSYLNSIGLKTSPDDFSNINENFKRIATGSASLANSSSNNLTNVHNSILLNNGSDSNTATFNKAVNLTEEAKRNLNEKKSLAKNK